MQDLTRDLPSQRITLKLVDATIRHECQKEMTILQCVRQHKLPVLDHATMEGVGWAHRASERERSKLELVWSQRFPRSTPTVAVDPRAYITLSPEGDRVLRRVIGRQHLVVTTLKLDELPGRAAEASYSVLRRSRRAHTAGDGQKERRQQQTMYPGALHPPSKTYWRRRR